MHRSEFMPVLKQRAHLAGRIARRRIGRPPVGEDPVDRFHRLYYEAEVFGGTWRATHWMGVPVWKCPFDLWVYQELLYDLRPDVVVETGTGCGGSALFFASVFDVLGRGRVISVDLHPKTPLPTHDRIRYIRGSSTDPLMVEQVRAATEGAENVLVVLDSDHRCAHVLEELYAYSPWVPVGGYVVVEDTNVNGHPVMPEWGPGPMEAVDQFVADRDGFLIDRDLEKFKLTMNPRGFLRRVR